MVTHQGGDDLEAQKVTTNASTATTSTQAPHRPARAGRGGAGNFVDTATLPDQTNKEIEAESTQSANSTSVARPPTKGYSGRGGAGNYVDSSSSPSSAVAGAAANSGQGQADAAADRTQSAVSASVQKSTTRGYSGRGGAGNWVNAKSAAAVGSGDEVRMKEMERKAVEDVEAGLAKPVRAHTSSSNKNKNANEDGSEEGTP